MCTWVKYAQYKYTYKCQSMCMSVIIHEHSQRVDSTNRLHAVMLNILRQASCSQQRRWALLCSSGTVIVLNHCYAVNISLTVALHSPQSKHENTVEYRDAVARSCEVHVSAATKLWRVFLTRDTKLTTRWDFLYRQTQQPLASLNTFDLFRFDFVYLLPFVNPYLEKGKLVNALRLWLNGYLQNKATREPAAVSVINT